MRPGRAVLDEPPAVAVVAVLAQSRVERLQQFRVDAGDLDTAQQGSDVLLDHEHVPTAGRRFDIEDFEPAVQEVADVRARACVPLLVHLAEQPGAPSSLPGRHGDLAGSPRSDRAGGASADRCRRTPGRAGHRWAACQSRPLALARTGNSRHKRHASTGSCHDPCHARRVVSGFGKEVRWWGGRDSNP